MTKNNKKNWLLGLGITTAFAGIFGTSIGLYFAAGDLINIVDKKEYLIRSNSKLSLDGYYFDTSASYGTTPTKSDRNLMNSDLLRAQTLGETKFIKDSTGKLIVSKSSESKLILQLAKEIVVNFKSTANPLEEKQIIFDSDQAEINPSLSLAIKPETVNLKSNNKKSINSDYFNDLLAFGKADLVGEELVPSETGTYSLKSLGFTVKENVPWVDHNGKPTKYMVSPRDFYYSFMRTKLFDKSFRRSNGGSQTLDTYFINATSSLTRFREEDKYPNEYLLNLFGVDVKAFVDETQTITEVSKTDPRKMFTVSVASDSPNPDFASLITKTFLNSNLLAGAPSEFIDELVAKNKDKEYPTNVPTNNGKEKITGLAEKFGIYLYGQQRVDNLFASAYVPILGQDNRIVFAKNKHFALKDFIEDKTTLEKIIFEFSNSPTFKDQLFNNFFEGTVSEMDYSLLTQQQKIKIFGPTGNEDFAAQKGLLQVKQTNKSQLVQRTLLSTDPRKFSSGEKGNYYFNETYARLIYGSSIEQLKAGTAITSQSFFNGTGFELRTLFNAAINWYTFINNSTNGLKKMWLNHTAPDANYNNVSDSSRPIAEPTINNIGYFLNDKKVVITEEEMITHFNNNLSNNAEQYKSPKFNEIKTIVEKILDEQGVTAKNPLSWSIVYPYTDAVASQNKILQLEQLVKTLKSLDSKGRLQPTVFVPNNREEMLDAVNQNKAVSDFNGWGYDYEGIGSFIDGISHGKGISLLGAFSLYSNVANTKLRTQSPEFAKLSDEMRKILNPKLPVGLKVEDWTSLTNDQNNNLDLHFNSKNYDISTELAKFFLYYQGLLNNQEVTALIIELNIIAGFSMETDLSINDPNTTSLALVLPEYFFPTTKSGILYLIDIRTGDK